MKNTEQTKLHALIETIEDYNFVLHEYYEEDQLCGYELVSWTGKDIDMLHFIDCRPNGVTANGVMDELKSISANFSVDDEVCQLLQSRQLRELYSAREILEDIEEYEELLTDMVRACQAKMDSMDNSIDKEGK